MTGGVKRLPPVGLMLFSVSDGAGLEGVVVVVDVDGPLFSPPEQATTTDDITAKMSRHAALRRRWVEFTFACLPPFASVDHTPPRGPRYSIVVRLAVSGNASPVAGSVAREVLSGKATAE